MSVRVGTAGWSIRSGADEDFPPGASILERYAQRFPAVEINSSFYRSHRVTTYERWAASTPAQFKFAVKVPRAITHVARLVDCQATLQAFLDEVGHLGAKLGPLLVQLPPSLRFDAKVADAFFGGLRDRFDGLVACEPRHAGWFTAPADALLVGWRVARVAADPPPCAGAQVPGGWPGLAYHRLHGSPRMYYSEYGPQRLGVLAEALSAGAYDDTWCVFDNTAAGAALHDAFSLLDQLASG